MTSGEVTHTAPQPFNAGSLAFSFTLEASMQAGAVTLYAAGNSVNFDTTNAGDRTGTATLNPTVVDSAGPMNAGTVGDAGTGGTGPIVGGGASSSDGGVAPVGDGNGGNGPGGGTLVTGSGRHGYAGGVIEGGCSAAGGAPLVLLLLAVALRRQRAR